MGPGSICHQVRFECAGPSMSHTRSTLSVNSTVQEMQLPGSRILFYDRKPPPCAGSYKHSFAMRWNLLAHSNQNKDAETAWPEDTRVIATVETTLHLHGIILGGPKAGQRNNKQDTQVERDEPRVDPCKPKLYRTRKKRDLLAAMRASKPKSKKSRVQPGAGAGL